MPDDSDPWQAVLSQNAHHTWHRLIISVVCLMVASSMECELQKAVAQVHSYPLCLCSVESSWIFVGINE